METRKKKENSTVLLSYFCCVEWTDIFLMYYLKNSSSCLTVTVCSTNDLLFSSPSTTGAKIFLVTLCIATVTHESFLLRKFFNFYFTSLSLRKFPKRFLVMYNNLNWEYNYEDYFIIGSWERILRWILLLHHLDKYGNIIYTDGPLEQKFIAYNNGFQVELVSHK